MTLAKFCLLYWRVFGETAARPLRGARDEYWGHPRKPTWLGTDDTHTLIYDAHTHSIAKWQTIGLVYYTITL